HIAHGEKGRIGRDDELLGNFAAQAQIGDAEHFVLIVELKIKGVIARFGKAPGRAMRSAVLYVTRDDGVVRIVQQGVRIVGQKEGRHEILKERAAPAEKRGTIVNAGERASETKPVTLW